MHRTHIVGEHRLHSDVGEHAPQQVLIEDMMMKPAIPRGS